VRDDSDYSLQDAPELPWDRVGASIEAGRAAEYLSREIEESQGRRRALRSADRQRLEETTASVVLALYGAPADSCGGWRRYGRSRTDYGKPSRYNQSTATLTTVTTVTDWLIAEGYAENILGFFRRNPFGGPGGSGSKSRIRATPKLRNLLEADFGLTPSHVTFALWAETIVLRAAAQEYGGIKHEIDYAETDETRSFRSKLQQINESNAKHRISVLMPDGTYKDMPPFRLRRIFNNSSFAFGGRFYGGPWQGMPAKDRVQLLIDGEEVVEADFAAMHPRLIYAIEGSPLDHEADPYALPKRHGAGQRGYIKQGFQQLLNAGPEATLRKPKTLAGVKLGKGGWTRLLEDIATKHRPIARWFRSGRGVELQHIDSEIAEGVLLRMVEQGVCCLPVHDSFIVPSSQKSLLHQTMQDVYAEVLASRGCEENDPPITFHTPTLPHH